MAWNTSTHVATMYSMVHVVLPARQFSIIQNISSNQNEIIHQLVRFINNECIFYRGVLRAGDTNRDNRAGLKIQLLNMAKNFNHGERKQTQQMVQTVPSYYHPSGAYPKI